MPGTVILVIMTFLSLVFTGNGCRTMDYTVLRMEVRPDSLYGRGSLSGFISDRKADAPVAGVLITIGGTPLGAVTDPTGHYQIDDIPAGDYCISAEMAGYVRVTCFDIDVIPNRSIRLDIGLEPSEKTQ